MTRQTASDPVYLLSFAQRRLWFLHQLEPNNPCYTVEVVVRLSGVLDIGTLEQSVTAIAQHHPLLCSVFPTEQGQPLWCDRPSLPASVALVDLTPISETAREEVARQHIAEVMQTPFDLEQGPLWRVLVLKLNEHEHILAWILHKMVADARSCSLLLYELKAQYEAIATGQPDRSFRDTAQYSDFVRWQSHWLQQTDAFDNQLNYWKTQLDGAPPVLQLPLDRPRSPRQTFNGATLPLTLSATLTTQLRQVSQQLNTDWKTLILAAFKVLLYRYTNQDDVVIGLSVENRDRPEFHSVIGLLANTLVLRTDLSGHPSVRQVVQRVHATEQAAKAHADVPFEQVVDALHLERNLSYSPLFQVMVEFPNPACVEQLARVQVSEFAIDRRVSPFDVTLTVHDTANELQGCLTYNTDLFDVDTMQRFLVHWQLLLNGMVADLDQSILALPLLTEAEHQQLLVDWNNRTLDYPETCVHELIAAQAQRTPEAIALRFEDRALTYRELNHRSNQVAHRLIALGIEPGRRVGISMDRSLDIVVGILGILKAGGTYVPIDPHYPKDRLIFMLEDTQLPVMLTKSHLLTELPEHQAQIICLDSEWESIAQNPSDNPVVGVTLDHLAYIMFTSGSTGRPKGVAVTHRSLRHYVLSVNHELGITAHDTYLHTASFSFASSIRQSMIALTQGATVMIATQEQIRNPLTIYSIVRQRNITVMDNVPSFWRYGLQALESLEPAARQEFIPTSLRQIVFCGELLTWDIPAAIHRVLAQPPRMANFYAMTETTSVSLYHLPTVIEATTGPVPIGHPVANVKTYVLNPEMQPMPLGVPGELHVGGIGLSQGYFNRPELTAEKYVPNPWGEEGDRLHKTGDLARYRPDGTLEILGRIDDQVQLRGIRVELGEIEATLSQHPTVQTAVVIAREDVPGEKRVVAYLIAIAGAEISTSELRSFLRERLPDYMVPAAFVVLDALPLNANRKVNRRALPAPDPTLSHTDRALVPARDLLEAHLIKIWEEVLGVSPIGIRDNFFDLGGHSLLMMQLSTQIEKMMGKQVLLANLFQAPTIEQLAGLLRQRSTGALRSLVSIHPDGNQPPLFLIHAVGGYVIFYQRLVRHLPDRPIYGLQAQGVDGLTPPLTSVEAMATYYIQELKTVQPQGPYYLGGLSFGGLVALEMAHQLQAAGDEVALVALIDTRRLGYLKRSPLPWLRYQLKRVTTQGSTYIWNRISARMKRLRQPPGQHRLPEMTKQLRVDAKNPNAKDIQRVVAANLQAAETYQVKPYGGAIALFRAAHEPVPEGWVSDPTLGWSQVCTGHITLYDIPSRHFEMFDEPQITHLVQYLQRALAAHTQS